MDDERTEQLLTEMVKNHAPSWILNLLSNLYSNGLNGVSTKTKEYKAWETILDAFQTARDESEVAEENIPRFKEK